jgi:large subunit ribosomal protein L17
MRHLKAGRKLGRTYSHKKATLANLAKALFEHKSIITTVPKAKEARSTVERLITFGKKGDLASRRHVLRTLSDKELVRQLFEEIAPKYTDRNGGYTRIVKIGHRQGDNAQMAIFELVGFEGAKAAKIEKQRQKREEKAEQKKKKAEEEAAEAQAQEAEGEGGEKVSKEDKKEKKIREKEEKKAQKEKEKAERAEKKAKEKNKEKGKK